MIRHGEKAVAGVRYFLRFNGEPMGCAADAPSAMTAVDRNPGMVAEAEVWNIVDHDYGTEATQPRFQVYPTATVGA